jgi:anti-sigma regulatory factor (Ser/Thr protein kinase)
MPDDAFLTEPDAGAARAGPAGTQPPALEQDFDGATLYALRSAVQAHAARAGLSEDRAGDVVLAIHELAANAVAHGAGHGRLRMWTLPAGLTCEIVDSGSPGTPAAVDEADPCSAEEGHGLWLVRQVADHLDFRSGPHGTRALLTFTLPPPSPAPRAT